MAIDEELWKSAHLELIHKELKRKWKKAEYERLFSVVRADTLARKKMRDLEIIKSCKKWPRILRRYFYKWLDYDLKEMGIYE